MDGKNRIFISYRRTDSFYAAKLLVKELTSALGPDAVFIDVQNIRIGFNFRGRIERAIDNCDAVVVLTGDNWLSASTPDGTRRIDNPSDYVRTEICYALRRRTIPVIPVLVGLAKMPTESELPPDIVPLADRHAAELRPDSQHEDALQELVEHLRSFLYDSDLKEQFKNTIYEPKKYGQLKVLSKQWVLMKLFPITLLNPISILQICDYILLYFFIFMGYYYFYPSLILNSDAHAAGREVDNKTYMAYIIYKFLWFFWALCVSCFSYWFSRSLILAAYRLWPKPFLLSFKLIKKILYKNIQIGRNKAR